jgi:hypothetical protein
MAGVRVNPGELILNVSYCEEIAEERKHWDMDKKEYVHWTKTETKTHDKEITLTAEHAQYLVRRCPWRAYVCRARAVCAWRAYARRYLWPAYARRSLWPAYARRSLWRAYARRSLWRAYACRFLCGVHMHAVYALPMLIVSAYARRVSPKSRSSP